MMAMTDYLQFLGLDAWQFGLLVFCAMLVGFSKTGIGGMMMIAVPILAAVFGGKASTGIVLPMLIAGDVMAVAWYHRHADWSGIRRLLPWTLAGLLAGVLVGNLIDDRVFSMLIAVSIVVCLAALVFLELRGERTAMPDGLWFFALIGLAAGFTTMIGNVAGPIFTVYLLARRLPKKDFLGTAGWFFCIINLAKLPLQIFFWHNVTVHSTLVSLTMVPAIVAGATLGILLIRVIPEKPFRWVVIAVTALTAIRLFF